MEVVFFVVKKLFKYKNIKMKRPIVLFALFLFILSVPRFTYSGSPVDAMQENDPRMVVVISIDQMRYDFLERFAPYFKHGFKRLLMEGAVLTDAHHRHAITHTAAGHATLLTGCHPSSHGVVENDFYNPLTNSFEYSVVDQGEEIVGVDNDGNLEGRSPKNLLRSTLGDWMTENNRRSRIYSVAMKDRASILMGGHEADRAFWFDNLTTRFVSSSFYRGRFPEWAQNFDAKTEMAKELEEGWHKKFPEEVYEVSREDNFFVESGQFLPSFPHTKKYIIGRVNPAMKDAILLWTSPFGDDFTLRFARKLIEEEQLGQDEHVDLLTLSLSMADAIGHHYGPYSQEIQDYYLRADEYLGDFFAYLDQQVGEGRYVVALSSDHGVLPFPEELMRRGLPASRVLDQDFRTAIGTVVQQVAQDLGLERSFILSSSTTGFSLNYEEAYEKNITPAKLQNVFADALRELDFVAEVYTTADLEEPSPRDYYQTLFQRSTHPDRGYEMKIRFKENFLVNYRPNGTSHGSPYTYDTHVPIIFMGPQFVPGKHDSPAATVDFAPTIARALGIKLEGEVDGAPILQVIK